MAKITIPIASDHRGFALKQRLITWLKEHGYAPQDLGTTGEERCDATDFAQKLAGALKGHDDGRGILICGTGQAMAMTANRYAYIRAALVSEPKVAQLAREHNDANVLVLGADVIGADAAVACLETFLKTQFLGGRYADRRDKLTDLGGL
jgi:ribose 5-phosphate isomerase B